MLLYAAQPLSFKTKASGANELPITPIFPYDNFVWQNHTSIAKFHATSGVDAERSEQEEHE